MHLTARSSRPGDRGVMNSEMMIEFFKPDKSKLKISLIIFLLFIIFHIFNTVSSKYLNQYSSKEVDQMVTQVVTSFGQIDILVNNAGLYRYMDIVDMSDKLWAAHLSVNLTGAFYCLRAVARQMVKQNGGGRIINIASLNGKTPTGTSQTAYCTV